MQLMLPLHSLHNVENNPSINRDLIRLTHSHLRRLEGRLLDTHLAARNTSQKREILDLQSLGAVGKIGNIEPNNIVPSYDIRIARHDKVAPST